MLTDFLSDFLAILRPIRPTQSARSRRSKYLKNLLKNPPKMQLRDFLVDFLKILSAEHDPKKIRSLKIITERFSIDFEADRPTPRNI